MQAKERRQSDRVSLLSSIRIMESDPSGEPFSDAAQTLIVTLHGAATILKRELTPEQRVTIRCYGTGAEALARVVGKIEDHPDGVVIQGILRHANVATTQASYIIVDRAEAAQAMKKFSRAISRVGIKLGQAIRLSH